MLTKRIFILCLAAALALNCAAALAVEGADLSVQMVEKSAALQVVSIKRCTFQCSYMNNHPTKTVTGIDLSITALNSDRKVTMEDPAHYLEMTIPPLSARKTPLVYITDQNELAYLIISVQSVYFSDGTSETIDFAGGESYAPIYFKVV